MSATIPDPNAYERVAPPSPFPLDDELLLLLEQTRDTLIALDALIISTRSDRRLAPDRPAPESDTAQVNDPPEPRHN